MSYVVGEIVVGFFIRYTTINLDILKMPPPVMMFNSGQGWGRDEEWAFCINCNAYILLLLAKTVFLNDQGEHLFPLYDKMKR